MGGGLALIILPLETISPEADDAARPLAAAGQGAPSDLEKSGSTSRICRAPSQKYRAPFVITNSAIN